MFIDVKTLKNIIVDYAVKQKMEIWFKKNDLHMMQVKCQKNCPWYLFSSKTDLTDVFQVKTYIMNIIAYSCTTTNL